jgi:hypothetical protein
MQFLRHGDEALGQQLAVQAGVGGGRAGDGDQAARLRLGPGGDLRLGGVHQARLVGDAAALAGQDARRDGGGAGGGADLERLAAQRVPAGVEANGVPPRDGEQDGAEQDRPQHQLEGREAGGVAAGDDDAQRRALPRPAKQHDDHEEAEEKQEPRRLGAGALAGGGKLGNQVAEQAGAQQDEPEQPEQQPRRGAAAGVLVRVEPRRAGGGVRQQAQRHGPPRTGHPAQGGFWSMWPHAGASSALGLSRPARKQG